MVPHVTHCLHDTMDHLLLILIFVRLLPSNQILKPSNQNKAIDSDEDSDSSEDINEPQRKTDSRKRTASFSDDSDIEDEPNRNKHRTVTDFYKIVSVQDKFV